MLEDGVLDRNGSDVLSRTNDLQEKTLDMEMSFPLRESFREIAIETYHVFRSISDEQEAVSVEISYISSIETKEILKSAKLELE